MKGPATTHLKEQFSRSGVQARWTINEFDNEACESSRLPFEYLASDHSSTVATLFC